MNKIILKVKYLLLISVFSAFASGSIVRIGNQDFTKADLFLVLNSTEQDPMEAVNKIKRDKAIQYLAESKNLSISKAENAVYTMFFGTSREKDDLIVKDRVLPMASKLESNLRIMLFERKIAEIAEKEISVSFIDESAFWEMVKNCKSYKVRKEQGFETSMSNWEYTWSELLVEPKMLIATKKDSSFLTGSEFNLWVKENYSRNIRAYAKRKHDKNEVRDVLAKRAVYSKLIAQKIGEKSLSVKEIYIDKALDNYINDNMMLSDVTIKDFKGKTFSDVSKSIYSMYKDLSVDKLNKIQKLLKGEEKISNIDSKEIASCTDAAVGSIQMDIINAISDTEIYDWIKANSFKGNFRDARMTLGLQKYEDAVDLEVLTGGIVINPFK